MKQVREFILYEKFGFAWMLYVLTAVTIVVATYVANPDQPAIVISVLGVFLGFAALFTYIGDSL